MKTFIDFYFEIFYNYVIDSVIQYMFLGHLCMNKRNFLRKGASLVGSGALLGSAFMPGSSAGAVDYKEMCQIMFNESWEYFFARMLAAIGIVFWRNRRSAHQMG